MKEAGENTVWLVGTLPGLLMRHLANTTRALAVSLTPCLLAKRLLRGELSGVSDGWMAGRKVLGLPALGRLLQGPRASGDGSERECQRGRRLRIAHGPLGTSPPQPKSHRLPRRQKGRFNIQATPMKCHGELDKKNQEEVTLTLGGGQERQIAGR